MKKELPVRPSLEQLKKQAKAILKGQQAADAEVVRRIQEHHLRFGKSKPNAIAKARFTLADAQHTLANEYGFKSWANLKARVEQEAGGATISNEEAVRALRDAACRGNLETLRALLDANPGLVNERGGEGIRTALHDAAGQGQEEAVKFLLERGANPNIRC